MSDSWLSPGVLLALYCAIVLLASLAGGWVLLSIRLTHTRMQVATSFVGGLMLGVGVLHMMPHAFHQLDSIDRVALWLLGGFLVIFYIQRFFHFHHHDVPDEDPEECCGDGDEHTAEGMADAAEHHHHTLAAKSARHLSWTGAALGLTIHTLIDGVALAASVEAEARGGEHGWLLGLGTFLVIVLHKPFDALALGTLMASGGWSRRSRHIVNGLFALANPVGVVLFYLGASQFATTNSAFLGCALAFTAGSFICIAASDLLPELQFHSHDRFKLSVALLAGLLFSVLLAVVETSGHDHFQDAKGSGEAPLTTSDEHDHDHEGHSTEPGE